MTASPSGCKSPDPTSVANCSPFDRKLYFDKETHRLLKSGAITYSDYKTFDGIPVARKEDDGHFMPEVTDFRVVDEFDSKLFEKP